MSPKLGRPPSENPKNERLHIRVTPQEKAEIMQVSQETGLSLLELLKRGIKAVRRK